MIKKIFFTHRTTTTTMMMMVSIYTCGDENNVAVLLGNMKTAEREQEEKSNVNSDMSVGCF